MLDEVGSQENNGRIMESLIMCPRPEECCSPTEARPAPVEFSRIKLNPATMAMKPESFLVIQGTARCALCA